MIGLIGGLCYLLWGTVPQPPDVLRLGPERVVDLDVGTPVGTAVTANGDLVVADLSLNELLRVSPEGEIRWRAGRKGEGPGEFTMIYRVAQDDSGRILAFDMATHEVSRFSPSGLYLDRRRLPFRFSQVDGLVALGDGGIALTGITRWGTSGLENSIHVFDSLYRHVRSFGPVPIAREDWVLERWGAGGLSQDEQGLLVFTRRLPYEIYVYRASGETTRVLDPGFQSELFPDDAYSREVEGNRVTFRSTNAGVLRPQTAKVLGNGWIISGRVEGAARSLDLFNPDGELHASWRMPPHWKSIMGVGVEQGLLWVSAEIALEPVLLVVPFQLQQG